MGRGCPSPGSGHTGAPEPGAPVIGASAGPWHQKCVLTLTQHDGGPGGSSGHQAAERSLPCCPPPDLRPQLSAPHPRSSQQRPAVGQFCCCGSLHMACGHYNQALFRAPAGRSPPSPVGLWSVPSPSSLCLRLDAHCTCDRC